MENIKAYLSNKLKSEYSDLYNIPEGEQYLNVKYITTYQINSLISIQKILETHNIKVAIDELANKLISTIDKDWFDIIITKYEIKFNPKNQFVEMHIKKLLKLDKLIQPATNKQKILVDFSSPNIAKDMHVGHLRSTIIGDSICKLYELLGHEVHRINHIGDFGLPFGMLIEHLFDKYPDYQNKDLTISDLQAFYAESKKRFDIDNDFQKKSYQNVVLLQSGDPKIANAWNFIKDISRKSYNEIYNRLDIKLTEVGESFYQNMIPDMINELKIKNILKEDKGRKLNKDDCQILANNGFIFEDSKLSHEDIVKFENQEMLQVRPGRLIIQIDDIEEPITVIKNDGGLTYDTTDLAAIKYRLVDLKMDKVFYVVGSAQSLHFKQIFGAAKKLGWLTNQIVKHIDFGAVLDEHGKPFKSRSGDTVKLIDLLSEAINKTKGEMEKNEKNITMNEDEKVLSINNVAYACIKYADLSTTRTSDYKFSYNKMVSFQGNTGTYQLYQYVRISAVLRNAGKDNVTYALDHFDEFKINAPEEKQLCQLLLTFPELIERVLEDHMLHLLCTYLYDITNAFSKFHKNCRCLHYNQNKELVAVDNNRLLICIATQKIFEQCFNILGIKKLDKM